VLTFNEAVNLEPCLRSVRDWASEIFVVDSGSTDETRDIARAYGCSIFEHPFETHSRQWAWALANLPLTGQWVLGLDADQRITPELAQEIRSIGNGSFERVDGIFIKRRQIFRGTWIKHGGYYPKYLLKLFRRQAVHIDENDLVDHHFHVNGPVARLRHDLVEANRKEDDIGFWIEKHTRYAKKLAAEELQRRRGLRPDSIKPSWLGNPDQRTLQMKRLWLRMPLYVRPFLYFFYRYFLRLGFLDGKEGAIFHFMHAFWFRLLVDIHLHEMLRDVQ
jgi:glycosyltransferase involved in cell wall biosynthesis